MITGVVGQWMNSWRPQQDSRDIAVFLEDDLEVSPAYLQFVTAAHHHYGSHPLFAGVSLQRADFVPKAGKHVQYSDNVRVFFYRLVGSWGYSPTASNWHAFRAWYFSVIKDASFKPYVDNLITTEWYKSFEAKGTTDTMWTQHYIYYMNFNQLYVCYANAPGKTTLAANWQEKGEHYDGNPHKDFEIYQGDFNEDVFTFNARPVRLDWGGQIENPADIITTTGQTSTLTTLTTGTTSATTTTTTTAVTAAPTTYRPASFDGRFIIYVLTYKRASSLQRLLNSLVRADYGGTKVNDLHIVIDMPRGRTSYYPEVIDVAESLEWPHGEKVITRQPTNQGIVGQWLNSWKPSADSDDRAVFLEDDLEVAPHFAQWIHAAHDKYLSNPNYAGVTLQRASFVPLNPTGNNRIYYSDNTRVFWYKLVGSWGYSPSARIWHNFQEWYFRMKRDTAFHPYVDGLKTTEWYKSFEKDGTANSMWTQWYIYYTNQENLYTCYANAPGPSTFATNWQEPGEHFAGNPQADFSTYMGTLEGGNFDFPLHPIRLGFDGAIERP